MTEPEILELIARLLRGEGSDEQFGEWIEKLKRDTKCPHILQLLRDADSGTTPEAILQKARRYRPIQL
jgi:hypothetical protein